MTRIGILALPGCFRSAVYGVMDLFSLANTLYGDKRFACDLLTPAGEAVESFSGDLLTSKADIWALEPDVVLLPPIFDRLEEVLAMERVVRRLADLHCAGSLITTVCAGSFLLAETGVLDGRSATTHWGLAEAFRGRYPRVNLQVERLLINGGDYICAGGVTAYMDLALHLVARFINPDISRQCARMMLIDPVREHQTPYGMGGFRKNHGDAAVLEVQLWLETAYARSVTVGEMAQRAGLGERTFHRRFKAATGETPVPYLQQLRAHAAGNLLENTDQSLEAVTEAVGYGDSSAFRKMFSRVMGCSPMNYRRRFGSRGRGAAAEAAPRG